MIEYIRVTLERSDGQQGYVWWQDGDKGLQVGMIDGKTGCKIIAMDLYYKKPKGAIFND